MTLPVHWVESLTGIGPGDLVELEGDEAHHAVAVRRLRVGERLTLTDGAGTTLTGVVHSTGKRRLVVEAAELVSTPEPEPRMTVVQALPKGDRGELAVEVLTEVGAAAVIPWAASRSVAVWKGERAEKSLARWRSTAREAAKQSRRAWFPQIAPLATTDEVTAMIARADLSFVLHEDAPGGLATWQVPETGSVLVVVGPEGGLSEAELAAFTAAGAHAVRLGHEVLRTSTAGVVALAALLARTGRWAT